MRAVNDVCFRRARTGTVLLLGAAVLSACGGVTENQLGNRDGVGPTGDGLSGLETVALFGLVPLLLLLVVGGLVWLPGVVRGSRYRPAKGWAAAPLWFGGPPDPAAAVETAETGDLVRGGASGSW